MSGSPEDVWALEIRDYLIGRLAALRRVEALPIAPPVRLTHPPIRRWWIFEGKQYRTIGGPLAGQWDTVIRIAKRLQDTFNPRIRISDRADGVVDWGQTFARGASQCRREYVVRSSGVGLGEDEHAALRGWMGWVRQEWAEYGRGVKVEGDLDLGAFGSLEDGPFGEDRLRRWAHAARRSRWPFLRDVVAESLRPVLEPDELDHIPLPSERERLFELLCLVRMARTLAPPPRDLRWLDASANNNTVMLDGVRCHYQQSLTRNAVLTTPGYAGGLARAAEYFGVGVPESMDLALDFDEPRKGFDGIIVEAKSGNQPYKHTVAQLQTYSEARPRNPGSRYIVWGIVEHPDDGEFSQQHFERFVQGSSPDKDLWLFSGADSINAVLNALFGNSPGSVSSC